MKPTYVPAYDNRALLEFELGHFREAAADFAQAMRLTPGTAYRILWLHIARNRSGAEDKDEFAQNAAPGCTGLPPR